MALHGPNARAVAQAVLPDGTVIEFVSDNGRPQGCAFVSVWWRLERSLPPATALLNALVAMLPPAGSGYTIETMSLSESAWYNALDLAGAVQAARAGTLDAWWAATPSGAWWGALPVDVRGGFAKMMAALQVPT